jgi:hypothetical protein
VQEEKPTALNTEELNIEEFKKKIREMLASGIGGGGGSNTEGNNSPVERRSECEKGMIMGGERMVKIMMMPMSKSR